MSYEAEETQKFNSNDYLVLFCHRHIEYQIEFFRSGFNAIVIMWLAGICKETLEEMDEINLEVNIKGAVNAEYLSASQH